MDRRRAGVKTRPVALSLALAGALVVALVLWGGVTPGALWAALRAVPAWAYLPIALVQGTIVTLAAWKWRLILGAGGRTLPLRAATAATALGTMAGQAMPIQLVTPAIRAWVARPFGIAPGRAVGSSLLEQVFEVIVLGAMALAGLAAQLAGLGAAAALALALTLAALLAGLIRPGLALAQLSLRALAHRGPLAALAEGFGRALALPHALIYRLTGLSLARYALLAGLNVGTLMLLAPAADARILIAAFPLVLALTALPILPAGLGAVELTWSGVLVAQGLNPVEAASAALALRLVTTFGFLLIAPLLIDLRGREVGEAADG